MSAGQPSSEKSSSQDLQVAQEKAVEQAIRERAPDLLNAVPTEKRLRLVQVVAEFRARSGPLPDPAELAAYSQIIPEGADRIMKMAEAQSAHRIEMEKMVIGSQQLQAARGQIFGLFIGLAGLLLGTYAAVAGQPWFGATIGGTTLVSLVTAFLYSHHKQKRELEAKRPAPTPESGKRRKK